MAILDNLLTSSSPLNLLDLGLASSRLDAYGEYIHYRPNNEFIMSGTCEIQRRDIEMRQRGVLTTWFGCSIKHIANPNGK